MYKQFTNRRAAAQEQLTRALASGLARYEAGPAGTRLRWMPGFNPLEYLRACNLAVDPVLGGTPVDTEADA